MLEDNLNKFDLLVAELRETYAKKNKDYGDSFNESMDEYGMIAFLVRAGDKLKRIRTLSTKTALVTEEQIEDTLKDLANYSIMAVMWLEGKREEDNAEEEKDNHYIPGGY